MPSLQMGVKRSSPGGAPQCHLVVHPGIKKSLSCRLQAPAASLHLPQERRGNNNLKMTSNLSLVVTN